VRAALVVGACACVCGCGGADSGPSSSRLHDVEAATRAANRGLAMSTAFVGAGIIEVSEPDATLALAVYQHVKAETNGCAMATPMSNQLAVDFGHGCTLGTGAILYGGMVAATVAHDANGVTVALTLDGTVDGQKLSGTFAISTADGNAFTYAGDLILDGAHAGYPMLTAGIASSGAQATATGTLVQPEGAIGLSLQGLHQRFTGCFPDMGSVSLALSSGTLSVSFASDAPQTGLASYANGSQSPSAITLPARAGCP
jgi:hypothetical protein